MDALSVAIMEELLDEGNASLEEREAVTAMVQKTGNCWDTKILLAMHRMVESASGVVKSNDKVI